MFWENPSKSQELFRSHFSSLCSRMPHCKDHFDTLGYRDFVSNLSIVDQLIYDIMHLVEETANGSLHQWAINPTGDRYDFTVDHLHKIGAFSARDTLLAKKQFFPDKMVPFSQEERREHLFPESKNEFEAIQDMCDDLSTKLLLEAEDIFHLCIDYLDSLGADKETFTKAVEGRW